MKQTLAAVLLACSLRCATAPARPAAAGADFEMTTYYMGLIYKGAAWTPGSTPETEKIQAGHMANMQRLAGEGKLLLAGPMGDDGDLRGIFVFKVGSMEEAQALVATDPAVQAGRLRVELHPWYSAKNIVVYPTAAEVPQR
jgi:uncharacterized protein YciI